MHDRDSNQKLKVLIVDDEALLAQLLKINLELKGYDVCPSAHSGAEALSIAQREKPDAVIMDVHLHNDDGITVAEQIQNRITTKIIFTTGSTTLDDRRRVKGFIPHAYLIKPVDPEKLFAILEDLQQ